MPKASREAAGDPTRPFQRTSCRRPTPGGSLHGSLALEDEESGLAQQDPAHAVLGVLGQDQGGPPQEGRHIRLMKSGFWCDSEQVRMPLFLTCKPRYVCIV